MTEISYVSILFLWRLRANADYVFKSIEFFIWLVKCDRRKCYGNNVESSLQDRYATIQSLVEKTTVKRSEHLATVGINPAGNLESMITKILKEALRDGLQKLSGVAIRLIKITPSSENSFPATTNFWNRMDFRQPSEKEICSAAESLVSYFDGDRGKAELWLIEQAIRLQDSGDRTRNLIAVRMSRAVRKIKWTS